MRKTYKIIGNALELEDGSIVRSNNIGVILEDGSALSGEIVIDYINHMHHINSRTIVMCNCGQCKSKYKQKKLTM